MKQICLAFLGLALAGSPCLATEEPVSNTLTAAEKATGWKLLFNGKDLAGWHNFRRDTVRAGWQVKDGTIACVDPHNAGNLVAPEEVDWFELQLDYNIAPGGNSGVIFHISTNRGGVCETGPEVQLQDNATARNDEQSGWLFGLYRTANDPATGKPLDATTPAGEWNHLRLLITPEKCEHELNGVKYFEYVLGSEDFKARVAKSKFAEFPDFGTYATGGLALQGDHGQIAFRNIKIRPIQPVSARKPDFAAGPPIDQPTGFFHTKKIAGRWWIVDPNGRAFYSIGTDHVNFGGHSCEALGYAPYGRNAKAKYGTEEKWNETQLQRLTTWGFNTLPYAGEGLRHRNLAHIETLSLGTSFSDTDSLSPKTTWTGLPNVFSPEWPKHCDRVAREHCTRVKNDPWVLGYFLDNELEWFGTDEPVGLFGATWRRPAGDSAKEAWVKFLRTELGDVKQFEKHWGVRVASFEELARHQQPVPPQTDKGRALVLNFLREIAERYFRACAEAIHRYDPNHLILGCRFASRAPAIWDIAGRHCDIVTFNYYKWIDVERGVPVELVREMTDWYEQAQKPMMLTEWSFPALDAGLPSIWGGGMRVDTQAQRTRCFEHFQSVLFGLPFMVGSSWFMYIDEPAQGISKTFPEDSNYGLIDVNDEPYPELTTAATRLNAQVYALHGEGEMPPLARKGKLAKWVTDARPVKSSAPPERLQLTTGALSLEGPVDGHAWRLREGNVLLGDLFAYFQQDTEGWLWVPTDAARVVAVREDRRATVVDMEMSSAGKGPVITRLTVDYSRPGAKNLRPCNYRGVWRFVIPKGTGGWVSMQCLWFENTDSVPWTAVQSYYFLMPALGGETRDDVPLYAPDLHAYWLTGAAWVDKAVGTGAGCWFLQDPKLECTYWVDAKGRYRADMRYELKEQLAPGQRWTTPGPVAFFFPLQGATRGNYEQAVKRLTEQVVVGGGTTKPTRASLR